MNKINLCIWMNIPSHHQKFFFEELHKCDNINLRVFYYDKNLQIRRERQGWVQPDLSDYEQFADDVGKIYSQELADFIHIIPSLDPNGGRKLAELAVKNNLIWYHWGEGTGVGLAQRVHFQPTLIKILLPVLNYFRLIKYRVMLNKYAKKVMVQGKLAEKDYISWGIKKEKIRYLFYSVPAVDVSKINSTIKDFAKGRKVILCCGSLCEGKGEIFLLRAFNKIHSLSNDWCLVFVGMGSDKNKLLTETNKMRLSDSVLFFGSVGSNKIGQVYANADLFILPTLFDGWAVVLNEAASAGLPIISTDFCGAAYHLVEPGKNGFRIKTKSVDAIFDAWLYYYKNPQKLIEHGQYSKRLFQNFTPKKNVERLLSILQDK